MTESRNVRLTAFRNATIPEREREREVVRMIKG